MSITLATPVYVSPLAALPSERSLPSTAEKIASSYGAGIAHRIQFLPYLETPTKDTPEIRIAMRAMLKDPYVKAAWFTQCFSVAASDWQVQPSSKDPEATSIAEFIKDCIERLAFGFSGLALGITLPLGPDGVSIVEPVTEVEERGRWQGKWVPKSAKAKDIEHLYLMGDRYRNVTGVRSIRTPEADLFAAEEFLIARYAPIFDEVFGYAAFRASYLAYWMLDTVRKLRAIHHEKRTGGTLVGKYSDPSQRATLEDTLRRLKTGTWACVPEGTQIDVLQLTTSNDTEYGKFEEDKIRDMVVGITFAELQMLSSDSQRGDTEVHRDQSRLPIWYLTRIVEETINRQWIPKYVDWNFASAPAYPRLTIGGPDENARKKIAEMVKLAIELGYDDLDADHYAEALGLQRTNDPNKRLGRQPEQSPMIGGLTGSGARFSEGSSQQDGDSFLPELYAAILQLAAEDDFDAVEALIDSLDDDEDGAITYAEVVRWEPFTNPKTGRAGWRSPKGAVRYTKPPEAKAKAAKPKKTADSDTPKATKPKSQSKPVARKAEGSRATPVSAATERIKSGEVLTKEELWDVATALREMSTAEIVAELEAIKGGSLRDDLVGEYLKQARKQNPPPSTPQPQPHAQPQAQSQAPQAPQAEQKTKADLRREKIEKLKQSAKQRYADEKEKLGGDNTPASTPAAQKALVANKAILEAFRGGNVPREDVEEAIATLEKLTRSELLEVAKGLDAAATLTDKTPASKVREQIKNMVLRVWKTSDNVNH
jgi:hypothetical protein